MLIDGNGADAVSLDGGAPDLPPELGGEGSEEEELDTGAEGEEGEEEEDAEGDDDKSGEGEEGDDDDDGEVDLEKETDPEKLRAAALKFKKSSDDKTKSIKDLRRARRVAVVAGKTPEAKEFKPPFSEEETTFVKDLPQDKQEGMTDNEKRLHDDNVKIKRQVNDDKKEAHDKEVEAAKKAAENIDDSIVLDDEVETFVKDTALEFADGDKKKANHILKYFNRYNKDTSGLSEDELIERVQDAIRLAGNYQPPKDQVTKKTKGKPAKKASTSSEIDKIVDGLDAGGSKKAIDL